MTVIPFETILDVTAKAYGVPCGDLRDPKDEIAWEAREAFCWLAAGLTGRDPAEIGMAVSLSRELAEDAAERIAARLNDGRDLDERLGAIEVEVRTLVGLSDRIGLRLPPSAQPFAIARRLVRSERDAMQVPVADLMAVGAALIALAGSRQEPRSELVRAAQLYDQADRIAADARFTSNERPAARVRADALQKLKQLIGA